MAFSLMTYKEARPWAEAIKEEVLARRMPPWGAVKGFGDYRNDEALTPEQLRVNHKLGGWGRSPKVKRKGFASCAAQGYRSGEGEASEERTDREWRLHAEEETYAGRVVAAERAGGCIAPDRRRVFPDGSVEPLLLWLENYKKQYGHPFLLRTPLDLPAGTVIRGVPQGGSVALLPITTPVTSAR